MKHEMKKNLEAISENVTAITSAHKTMQDGITKIRNNSTYTEKYKESEIKKLVDHFIVETEASYETLQQRTSAYNQQVQDFNGGVVDYKNPELLAALTYVQATGGVLPDSVVSGMIASLPRPSELKQLAAVLPDNGARFRFTKAAEDAALPTLNLGNFDMEMYMTIREEGNYIPNAAAFPGVPGIIAAASEALKGAEK